ncbi:ribosome biogenesis GTP-binding protein YihA/YsxC [Alloprevotella tannerae]|jgi:ribosome biogenesis GTP-binding protein ysxC|uniref:ribosome biogenesis GTP-binding protein YihA/YsxC n=1 Tax=Alloprevotella tannerae TaxID=76122 RepID=UPI001CB442BC|nr:ribosome biogenesis GTP-binding protein YihA/YsxC [Alloprevotella tannerae]MBF0952236.1 YihA family ribosome biogenesis GTP-binding protein [Alloprevotella tannerae]
MKINTAEFKISSARLEQCPATMIPEYAFIGRSNVGKSSLINMLTGRSALAKTSSTPGKTLLINHFIINDEWFLVDLPGYGFAKRSKKEREELRKMIERYVTRREQLTNLFVLIDSRLKPQTIDLEFIRFLGEFGVPFSIIFTKADKNKRGVLKSNVQGFLATLKEEWEELPPYFVSSSTSNLGREEILNYIEQINGSLQQNEAL